MHLPCIPSFVLYLFTEFVPVNVGLFDLKLSALQRFLVMEFSEADVMISLPSYFDQH